MSRAPPLHSGPPKVVILKGAGDGGHRREYSALFRRLLEGAGATVTFRSMGPAEIFPRGLAISLMIEDHSIAFFLLAWARAALGRHTVGLLLIPRPCLHPAGLRHRLKRWLLLRLRRRPQVRILTLLPFSLEPGLAAIASGWIHDPQLWDVERSPGSRIEPTPLSREIAERAAGRTVVISLGLQGRFKGSDRMMGLCRALRSTGRYLFVAAGQVEPELAAEAEGFVAAGGMLVDRFLSDAEFLSLYGVATWMWACYAPDYDQSSGGFGRAVQTGAPALVRAGSLIHALAETLGHPAAPLAWGTATEMAAGLEALPRAPARAEPANAQLRSTSLDNLSEALGFPVGWTPDRTPRAVARQPDHALA